MLAEDTNGELLIRDIMEKHFSVVCTSQRTFYSYSSAKKSYLQAKKCLIDSLELGIFLISSNNYDKMQSLITVAYHVDAYNSHSFRLALHAYHVLQSPPHTIHRSHLHF
jgi:hypothetical protein